ncbi:MAG: hypothetical protein JWP99_1285 [Devosia sp.]|nr:hypothetical protein [Devosia sp.]
MSKTDRQQEQLKNVSGGGQTPGTNWGTTPGEATNNPPKNGQTPPAGKDEKSGAQDNQ